SYEQFSPDTSDAERGNDHQRRVDGRSHPRGSGASIWYEGHPSFVENRFASFPPYEVPSAANEKPPPDGSDGGFFLQLVA
ncbi:hypothetical protein, partial [Stutzerimonas nitrititolerans]|uniref:hypothetical protein n=1 Tax=Stutzerimonas nitrititolerans TaxID=2482751 RepID=UPI0028A18B50